MENPTKEQFDSRPYQIELYKKAKENNTIVCLGTGTGKTFIAILLIKDPQFAQQLSGDYSLNAKRTIFLVPTRLLVKQQSAEIRRHFDVKVGEYVGDETFDYKIKSDFETYNGNNDVKVFNESNWTAELTNFQVLVMTPAIFLNMLNHGFINFNKINLLIIDEAHWAAKTKDNKDSGHEYKQIMNLYHKFKPECSRPRVLGMTASLINSSVKPKLLENAIQDLEKTYDAVCNTSNVAQICATDPKEVIYTYKMQATNRNSKVQHVVSALQLFISNLNKLITNLDYKSVHKSCKSIIKCMTNVRNMLSGSKEATDNNDTEQENQITMSWMGIWCAVVAIDVYVDYFKEYEELYKNSNQNYSLLLRQVINFFNAIKSQFNSELLDTNCCLNTCSPKMNSLLDLLMKYKPIGGQNSELCGIVFVDQRGVARVLSEWFNKLKEINPNEYGFLSVGWVVGQASNSGFESLVNSFTDRKQQEMIQKFRDKELNLLIASSVLEEGLDVRQCNVVVRYGKPKTFRQYLQSKGRARAKDAFYYIMTSEEEKSEMLSQIEGFREIEKIINNLNDKQLVNGFTIDVNENESLDEDYTSGDARITERSAIALLYRYCQTLPSDSFTKLTPHFELEEEEGSGFRCSIELPINCPLRQKFIGDYRKNKSEAKRHAAFEVCKKLHQLKELNDRFLPISKDQLIEKYVESLGLKHYDLNSEDRTGQRPGTTKSKKIYRKELCKPFTKCEIESNTYYLHLISLQYLNIEKLGNDLMSFGAITLKPIDNSCSFPLFVKSGKVDVDFVPLSAIHINAQQKDLIEKFHSYTFSNVLYLQNNEMVFCPKGSHYSLLLLPMKSNKEIDWNFLQFIYKQKPINPKPVSTIDRHEFSFNRQQYEDCVFYPWYRDVHNPQYFNVIQITNMTPKSAFNDKRVETFEHFYRQEYNLEICNKSQLLIEGKLVQKFAQIKSFVLNKKTQKLMDKKEFFVPELVAIHPFPSSLWRQALCLPAILYRLNYLFLSEELRQKIHLETNPRIGDLQPMGNKLILNPMSLEDVDTSETLERIHNNDECDDGCDGHPFDIELDPNEFDEFLKKPMKKRQLNSFPLIPIESDSRGHHLPFANRNGSSNLINVSSTLNNTTNSLLEFAQVLINQFNHVIQNSRETNAFKMNQINYNPMSNITSNCPPAYGDISLFIRNKYDAKIEDPICGPTADVLLNALTLNKASDSFNLERLETIGDSFLKFVTTAYLYYSCPELDQGKLTFLRSIQICNCNLYHIGKDKGIADILVATKFDPKENWLPPCFESNCLIKDDKIELNLHLDQKISDKSIADSVEALIGAYLLSGGNKSAINFMQWLGLKVSPNEVDFCTSQVSHSSNIWQWLPLPQSPTIGHLSKEEIDKGLYQDYNGCNLDNFEKIIEYTFEDKAFLVQAFTHSSYIHNQITDCYQRLEFLGDSVLDYLITRHIFKDKNKFSPGEITDLRSALVNNSYFALIAVKSNFHKYLKVLSPDLFRAIDNFVKRFEECEEDVDVPEEVEVPKALGDVFESVAGAIFLDSGLSLDMVWKVYYKLIKPDIDRFSKNIPKMPVRELMEKTSKSSTPLKFSDSQQITGRKIKIVAEVNGKQFPGIGSNTKLAKIAAAKSALRNL